ncbi:MAG: MlaD family protein [Cytophagales bacterium]
MKFSKELKVGVLAVVSSVMLYTGINFLKGIDFFSTANRYYVIYDNIAGLNVSSPVLVSGYTVGRVESIKLLPKKGYKLFLTLQIDKKLELSDSTVALLVETSPLGDKAIELKIKEGNRILAKNDTIFSKTEKGMIASLSDKMAPIMSNLDASMAKINSILASIDTSKLKASQENLTGATVQMKQMIAENRVNLGNTTRNVSNLTASLIETEKNLKPMLQKFNLVADSLSKAPIKQTVTNANLVMVQMNDVMTRLNKGEGTLGKLSKNDSLYTNLNNSANSLDKLLEDLRLRPKRYVHFSLFGRKNKEKEKK